MADLAVATILVVVGLVNLAPVSAARSAAALARTYGIPEPGGDIEVLLRHRAVLFGIVGGVILVSAIVPALQFTAVIMAYASMASYLVLVAMAGKVGHRLVLVRNIDIAALVLLTGVPVIWAFTGVPS